MKHFNITFEPEGRQISIHCGATLLEAAAKIGIILNTVCGGKGTCKKCLVRIEPDGRDVLACQYHIASDLTVTVPLSSRFFEQQILESGIEAKTEISPAICKKYREKDGTDEIFGLAVDIGTTTVVARLVDMGSGQCLATDSAQNPQAKFGDDIISRIAYAQTAENAALLQQSIIDCINGTIVKLCKQASIRVDQIYEICAVGNTAMSHLFLGFPVTQLGRAPYKAHSLDAHDLPAEQLGIKINPIGNVHTVENIAGFVGSDTTAVALAAGIMSEEKMTLIVDIGTNGEIVLGTKDKLYAASCAAGPALEGAGISCGSRAFEGAIEAVVIAQGDVDIDVIGNSPPRSICGSGLIDAVAVMLDLGIIDASGRFTEPDTLQKKLPTLIFARIIQKDNEPAFKLAEGVFLTQRDIRQMQLAKAAIRAGITLLQRKIGLAEDDIEQVFLAGAFGNYIRAESALRTGLLPAVGTERIHFIGNAAASGAQMILLSRESRQMSCELARMIEYIEIAHQPDFQNIFADSIPFNT